MPAPAQLPLPFIHRPAFATDFLEAPSNSAALAWLARTEDWPDGRLAVWGEAGCGKSHLLHLWASRSGARYFSGPSLPAEAPVTGLAIDDSDLLADETVLLHTLNAALEARVPVLLAARLPPARWQTRLADLASRLRAVTAVEIAQAEDSLLRALFARLLRGTSAHGPAGDTGLAVAAPAAHPLRYAGSRGAARSRGHGDRGGS